MLRFRVDRVFLLLGLALAAFVANRAAGDDRLIASNAKARKQIILCSLPRTAVTLLISLNFHNSFDKLRRHKPVAFAANYAFIRFETFDRET